MVFSLPSSSTKIMSSSLSSSFLLCCIVLVELIHLCSAISRVTLPPGIRVPAIFGFGDSIIDPGNNNYILTPAKSNYPPYGRDFMGGVPTGRFSNGKIPTDLIAEALGIKDLLPPYLDPTLKPNDLLTGVSFASGAAGYDPLTSKLAGAVSIPKQVELFGQYLMKIKPIAGEKKYKSIVSESLFVVFCGSDDIANTYFGGNLRSNYDFNSYADLMVKGASDMIQGLYGLGARRFGITGAPPIGCLPSQRTLGGGLARMCVGRRNKLSQIFNSKLSSELDRLNSKLTGITADYIDIYTPLLQLINHPDDYGFAEVSRGCCGTGKIESIILCNKLNPFTCVDDSKYVFWDSYHPTERAYVTLLEPIVQRYSHDFFCKKGSPC